MLTKIKFLYFLLVWFRVPNFWSKCLEFGFGFSKYLGSGYTEWNNTGFHTLYTEFWMICRGIRDVEGRGRSQWRPGGSIDPWSQIPITLMRIKIKIQIKWKAGSGFAFKFEAGSGSAFKWKAGSGSALKWCGSPTATLILCSSLVCSYLQFGAITTTYPHHFRISDCKGTAHSLRLRRVAECRENKMSLSNLAKILGPTLVGYSSSEPATMVAEVSAASPPYWMDRCVPDPAHFETDPGYLDPYAGLRIRIWDLIRIRILLFSSVALKMPTKNIIFHSVFLLITCRTFGVDPDPDLDPRI